MLSPDELADLDRTGSSAFCRIKACENTCQDPERGTRKRSPDVLSYRPDHPKMQRRHGPTRHHWEVYCWAYSSECCITSHRVQRKKLSWRREHPLRRDLAPTTTIEDSEDMMEIKSSMAALRIEESNTPRCSKAPTESSPLNQYQPSDDGQKTSEKTDNPSKNQRDDISRPPKKMSASRERQSNMKKPGSSDKKPRSQEERRQSAIAANDQAKAGQRSDSMPDATSKAPEDQGDTEQSAIPANGQAPAGQSKRIQTAGTKIRVPNNQHGDNQSAIGQVQAGHSSVSPMPRAHGKPQRHCANKKHSAIASNGQAHAGQSNRTQMTSTKSSALNSQHGNKQPAIGQAQAGHSSVSPMPGANGSPQENGAKNKQSVVTANSQAPAGPSRDLPKDTQ